MELIRQVQDLIADPDAPVPDLAAQSINRRSAASSEACVRMVTMDSELTAQVVQGDVGDSHPCSLGLAEQVLGWASQDQLGSARADGDCVAVDDGSVAARGQGLSSRSGQGWSRWKLRS